MPTRARFDDLIIKAIEARKQHLVAEKKYATQRKDAFARWESHTVADEKRRHDRLTQMKRRLERSPASAMPSRRKGSAAKPASKQQRHIPRNCCGRRAENCRCFNEGRGLEIATSFLEAKFKTIPKQVANSRIQYWRDTADMPAYMRQIGWNASMHYSCLFPIAFMWRHFSNEEVFGHV